MGAQRHINRYYPVAVEGDFASVNPYATALTTLDGGLRAGSDGLVCARFAWINDATGTASNTGTGTPDGFVRRTGYGVPLSPGQNNTMTILAGYEVEVYAVGDFWALLPASASPVSRGDVVHANAEDGTIAGSTGGVETRFHFASAAQPGELVKISAFGGV